MVDAAHAAAVAAAAAAATDPGTGAAAAAAAAAVAAVVVWSGSQLRHRYTHYQPAKRKLYQETFFFINCTEQKSTDHSQNLRG